MKVTFPHMGKTYITLKAMLEELNIDVITPPKCSKNTAKIGTKVSPEGICLPFKIMMGNYIESIEAGADTILMLNSCGDICRIGNFHPLQQDILKDMGYNVKMITVKPFGDKKDIKNFLNTLGDLSGCQNSLYLFSIFTKGIRLLMLVDKIYEIANKTRAHELHKGQTNKVLDAMEARVSSTSGYRATLKLLKAARRQLKQIPLNPQASPLKIGLVGEIYILTEDYTNLYIEKQLGSMGIEVHKMMTTSEFIKKNLSFIPFLHSDLKSIHKDAKPYLNKAIGGHTLETIGTTINYKKKGFDGVIHVMPFGCMPEIVSKGILTEVSKNEEIPILSLIYDELTGEAGYQTRLEAYIECITRIKALKNNNKNYEQIPSNS